MQKATDTQNHRNIRQAEKYLAVAEALGICGQSVHERL